MIGPVEIHIDSVIVGDQRFMTQYPVQNAFVLDDRLLVLYLPSSMPGKIGQFSNLVAFDNEANLVWTAELPTTETGDCYYRVISREPLIVNSVRSYQCTLDPDTGRLKSKVFLK